MKKLLIALLVLCVGMVLAEDRAYHVQDSIKMRITTAGDTAAVLFFTPTTELDSFVYSDSLVTNGAADTGVVSWTSPNQIMIITPDVATYGLDSLYLYDSITFPGTDVLGFDWTSPLYTAKFTPTSAIDSYTYTDTIAFVADTYEVTWTAPVMVMALTPGPITDSESYCDTTVTYVCSLALAGGTLGFTYDPSDAISNDSLACLVRVLVDSINNVAGISDSVTAEDSITYAKIISDYGQETYTARWTMVLGDSLDTATSVITSVAMVCDSMAAAVNAATNLSDSVTGADGTTYYTVAQAGPSHTYNRWSWYASDTAQDTTISLASTQAMIMDSLTYYFNNTTNLKDSVAAQDSGTYVKLISKFSGENFGGRWTCIHNDSFIDTAQQTPTTIAMIVDSMVTYFNADDTASQYATAANSGDTGWTWTSDDPGLEIVVFLGDSATDTSRTQANVTSKSVMCDTILLNQNILGGQQAKGINGVFFIDSTLTTTNQGIGLADSCQLVFAVGRERWKPSGWIKEVFELDSATVTSLPGSLKVSHDPAAAGADTLFKENMYLIIYVGDTASDTNMSIYYKVYKDYLLLDD